MAGRDRGAARSSRRRPLQSVSLRQRETGLPQRCQLQFLPPPARGQVQVATQQGREGAGQELGRDAGQQVRARPACRPGAAGRHLWGAGERRR
eukprot:527574-Pyramimonas_sp.AAC.1